MENLIAASFQAEKNEYEVFCIFEVSLNNGKLQFSSCHRVPFLMQNIHNLESKVIYEKSSKYIS